jgi:Zn-dependent protease
MDFAGLIFFFIIIVPSAIIHEYAHAWMADRLGDPTARHMGRLTLNPLVHIDLFGTILMPLLLFLVSQGGFLFAYAKPVPYNPFNLRSLRWHPALVGLAGPLSNLLLALIFGLAIRFLNFGAVEPLFAIIVYANLLLMVFNLIPVPPLDGSKILFALLPDSMAHLKAQLERYGFFILILLLFVIFRLIFPIISTLFTWIVGQSLFL